MTVGPSDFRAPPTRDQAPAPTSSRERDLSPPRSTTSMEQANSIISLFDNEEPSSPDRLDQASSRHSHAASAAASAPVHSATFSPVSGVSIPPAAATGCEPNLPSRSSASLDARIMEQLLTQPEPLARFVRVISTARSASSGPPVSVAEPANRSKYVLSPTAMQVTVHERITAPEHRGKAPSIVVERLSLLDFAQQFDGWRTWTTPDLPHLVFWVNSVLEQFRSLVHSSNGDFHASSLQTITQLSLNDGELQNLMHALSRRSIQDSQRQGSRERPPTTTTQRDRDNQRQTRIPPAIFDLIPTHNGLPVCLCYLSAMGCPSGSSNRRVYGARAHATPDTLDARRRGEIGDDPRPNKGLDPYRLQFVLQGYHYTTELVVIARSGIIPTWKFELPQARTPPKNHYSTRLFKKALLRIIRQGQAHGTYLVVGLSLLEQWKNIQSSSFGAVEKKGVDPLVEVRQFTISAIPT
ncbi:unnamed protein product [Phytophthora fragariaefolia]|uniref:Unnamed protein product n=1 Tax=Phytophthora fragariaefolia TaxID=1490495 RepID=A0A9W7D2Q5_9STRA|nr:unnamed protein product [Phytophthora fragariaefolia]